MGITDHSKSKSVQKTVYSSLLDNSPKGSLLVLDLRWLQKALHDPEATAVQ